MAKKTSNHISTLASEVLRDPNSSQVQKSFAGSALSQAHTSKQTSCEMATKASNVLQSNKYNETTKTLAGTVLSQSCGCNNKQ